MEDQAAFKARNLLIFRDAQNAEHCGIAPNWNARFFLCQRKFQLQRRVCFRIDDYTSRTTKFPTTPFMDSNGMVRRLYPASSLYMRGLRRRRPMELHTIGIDLGLVGLNLRGEVVVRKKFRIGDDPGVIGQ